MVIRSAGSEQVWERQPWGSSSSEVQYWVNDLVWKTLAGPSDALQAPPLPGDLPRDAIDNCRAVFLHNRLEGLVPTVWGDKLRPLLGDEFYKKIDLARKRTELFVQEVYWILGPALGAEVVLIDDIAMRPQYADFKGGGGGNPRFVYGLELWAPTLSTREELVRTLAEGGFGTDSSGPEGYTFSKETDGISHKITIHGTIWETTLNWTLDLEREVWDRARKSSVSVPMRPQLTDLFLFTCRRFAVDSLSGGGLLLRDLVTLVENGGEDLDWDRIRKVKETFHRPDWLWASLVALVIYEAKTGRRFDLPDWAHEGIRKTDSFWHTFVDSRLNWSNPDLRLIDFPRAQVKAGRGT